MRFDQRSDDRDEHIDDVVQFEYPYEPYFGAPSEDIVERNLPLPAGMVQFFIGGQFHQKIILGYKQLLKDKFLQFVPLGFQLIEFMFGRFGESFHLFV